MSKCLYCRLENRCSRHLGHSHTAEAKDKISQARKGMVFSIEHRLNCSKAFRGRIAWNKGLTKVTSKIVAAIGKCNSALMFKKWKQPEYVKMQMTARGVKPNKLERRMEEVLRPLGFRYVGDGQLVVGGKVPDFWDGDRRLIEVYGDYWHRGQDPADRIAHFKQHGYICIVLWESELKGIKSISIENYLKEFQASD